MSGAPQTGKRLRYGPLPVPDQRADLYWGTKQPELRTITDAKLTAMLLATPEFDEVLGSKLAAIDRRNQTLAAGKQAGRPSRWSARQLESVFLYRRVAGLESVKRTCERLRCDEEACALLGLGSTLPSQATLTRYLTQHFDAQERVALYRDLDRRLRSRVMALPGFDAEARKLGLDGSQHGTRYTAPILERKNGKYTGAYINTDIPKGRRGAVTAPDAGYVGGNHPKSGKGWQLMGLFTEHGTLVAWDISPLNEGETVAAMRVFDDYESKVLPHRDPQTLSVCCADAGFSAVPVRRRLQELRMVPNIHKSSHGDGKESVAFARKRSRNWKPFAHPSKPHYGNWEANGHGTIRCSCGAGKTERINKVSGGGHLTIATAGRCKSCGTVTITAGKWRHAQNPDRIARAFGSDEPDYTIGNSLTFEDPLSAVYGKGRFGWGESVHATLERRFGLLKDKSWMRSKVEVETEFAIAASAISVLLLERARRRESELADAVEAGTVESDSGADDGLVAVGLFARAA